jgi:cobalamin biosynthesis Mg chelatase CobN
MPDIDPVKLKTELKNDLIAENNKLLSTVQKTVEKQVKDALAANKTKEPIMTDVKISDSMRAKAEKLGLKTDEEILSFQAMIQEEAAAQAGKNKDEILAAVDEKQTKKERKQVANKKTAENFPDILDKESPLFKQAVIEYQNLPKELKDSPEGESIACKEAAAVLGIKPLTKADIISRGSLLPTGGNGEVNHEKESKKDNFAISLFGLKGKIVDKYKEKLKENRDL